MPKKFDPALCGIYTITNTVTGQVYVGQSQDRERRWSGHLNSLLKNKHKNPRLQNSFNKYGKEAFKFEQILVCHIKHLSYWENRILSYVQDDLRFNHGPVADPPMRGMPAPNRGKSPSKETRKKLSLAQKGRPHLEETRKKISLAHKGKSRSEEHRKNISLAQKGKSINPRKPPSEETRKKLSLSHMGKPAPNRGKSPSEETRKKLSEKNKAYWTRIRAEKEAARSSSPEPPPSAQTQ